MHISSLEVKNFRSIAHLRLNFRPGITSIVGENNVGKSTLFAAIEALLARMAGRPFDALDCMYGDVTTESSVKLAVDLMPTEQDQLADALFSKQTDPGSMYLVRQTLRHCLTTTELFATNSTTGFVFGSLILTEDGFYRADAKDAKDSRKVGDLITTLLASIRETHGSNCHTVSDPRAHLQRATATPARWHFNNNTLSFSTLLTTIGLTGRLRTFADFRARPVVALARSAILESFDGTGTIGVLFNLKNHQSRIERAKYLEVQSQFSRLFPGMTFEVVERSPGSGHTDIQFFRDEREFAISFGKTGAGISELLTLITNLVARESHVLLIEEPELHLHPHARRQLAQMVARAAERNQVFLITHDVWFANPGHASRILRMSMTRGLTHGSMLDEATPPRELAQIDTVLRDVANREMLFARCVLLVEDESIEQLIRGFARTLDRDLDAAGISVVFVGGHSSFGPFETLLKGLKIPCIRVRDKNWDVTQAPPLSWAFGKEVEDYLSEMGLLDLLERARIEVGAGKVRVAAWVAANAPRDRIPGLFEEIVDAAIATSKESRTSSK